MEPLFPDLLFLGPFFAPFLVRVGIAIVFLWEAKKLWSGDMRQKAHSAWALILGLMFAIGLFTQLIAMIGIFYIVVTNVLKKESLFTHKGLIVLAALVFLSLIITGAGYTPFPFADLPY